MWLQALFFHLIFVFALTKRLFTKISHADVLKKVLPCLKYPYLIDFKVVIHYRDKFVMLSNSVRERELNIHS